MDAILKALEFAFAAHKGGTRKGTTIPYIVHPMDVASILMKNHAPDHLVVAGLLHDTLEDTAVTYDQLHATFGQEVADLVRAASEPEDLAKQAPRDEKKKTWKVRKQHTIGALATAPLDVKILTCADKLANIRDNLTDHARVGDALWATFNAPKADQRWYFTSLVAAFGADARFAAHPIFLEFQRGVERLFGSA